MLAMMPPMPPRSHLVTDFCELTAGSIVGQGWTNVDAATHANWTVGADGSSLSGKALTVQKTTNLSTRRISWDRVGSVADVEVLARIKLVDAANGGSGPINVRAASGPLGYFSNLENFSGLKHTLFECVDDDNATQKATEAFASTTGVWYWRRTRVNGTTITSKVWAVGDPEPTGISATDNSLASGAVALGSYNTGQDYICDFFSVGLNGATAPGPAG